MRSERALPWKQSDAAKHTAKADSPKKATIWAKVANRVLAESGDEGRAVRVANAVVDGKAKRERNAARRKMSMKGEMRDRLKAHREGTEHYGGMDPELDMAD